MEIASVVTPQTLFAWHRKLIAKKYDSSESRMGRLRTKVDVAGLVVKFANENSGWGYGSIEGALLNLGHDIGRSTIARILKQAGVPIAPKRKGQMSWAEFLGAHWEVMAATDFFTTKVWTMHGLVRYHVLFVIRLARREVKVVGIIRCVGYNRFIDTTFLLRSQKIAPGPMLTDAVLRGPSKVLFTSMHSAYGPKRTQVDSRIGKQYQMAVSDFRTDSVCHSKKLGSDLAQQSFYVQKKLRMLPDWKGRATYRKNFVHAHCNEEVREFRSTLKNQ